MCDKIDRIRELSNDVTHTIDFVQKLTSALDASNEGIVILDSSGIFIYLNQAYENMSKYNSSELLNRSWRLLYNKKQQFYIKKIVIPSIRDKRRWSGELLSTCKDGTVLKQRVYLSSLSDGGLVCTCIKIDE